MSSSKEYRVPSKTELMVKLAQKDEIIRVIQLEKAELARQVIRLTLERKRVYGDKPLAMIMAFVFGCFAAVVVLGLILFWK